MKYFTLFLKHPAKKWYSFWAIVNIQKVVESREGALGQNKRGWISTR
jgi:hypothetical protein